MNARATFEFHSGFGARAITSDPISPPPKRGQLNALGLTTVGLELAVSIVIGWWIGSWMDERFDTEPWFLVSWVVIGAAAGFRNLFRTARRAMKGDDKPRPS